MRVLIADDESTCRVLLAAVLRRNGYEVLEAANGEEAWDVLRGEDAPRLAILDWLMPVTDGLEVVRRVRRQETILPPYILMLTTRGDKADVVSGLEQGADDYLTKPFHAGELLARVGVGRRLLEMQVQLASQVEALKRASEQIKTLEGIIPICMHCKNIRNDAGYWEQVEAYVSRHSGAVFSHGICPGCMKAFYPD